MKNLFKINIFTYIFLLLSILSGYGREMLVVFIILVIHELGHFFLMKFNNIDVQSITIYPYGGMIKSNMLINTNSYKVLLISLGGIFSQIILWMLFFCLYKFNLLNEYYFNIFNKYNLYIILFNLIPIYPLDGFKIFNSLLELLFSFKKSIYISFIINIISLIIFFVYLYINKINNYVIVLFMLISLINYIKESKYVMNKFYLERIIYNLDYNGLKSINCVSNIYKNNLNYINGVCEKDFLMNKYSIFF